MKTLLRWGGVPGPGGCDDKTAIMIALFCFAGMSAGSSFGNLQQCRMAKNSGQMCEEMIVLDSMPQTDPVRCPVLEVLRDRVDE